MNSKIEGVKDVFKWLEQRCKDQKRILEKEKEKAKKSNGYYYWFDDCGEQIIREEEIKLQTLVETKISVEKYMKKLKREEKEDEDD